jgi:hypothetical protein
MEASIKTAFIPDGITLAFAGILNNTLGVTFSVGALTDEFGEDGNAFY